MSTWKLIILFCDVTCGTQVYADLHSDELCMALAPVEQERQERPAIMATCLSDGLAYTADYTRDGQWHLVIDRSAGVEG
jgi:hypothetical protein